MIAKSEPPAFSILARPYRHLFPLEDPGELVGARRLYRGVAMVWHLERGCWGKGFRAIRDRPGGIALIVVLPHPDRLGDVDRLLHMSERCRPHTLLPYHPSHDPEELAVLLRRPPSELSREILDYLTWRGLRIDRDTRRLLARTLELSGQVTTVSGLARALYLSRRALGRRFLKCGIPVPSHWLHFTRVLRATIELQNSDKSLFRVACDLDYPDGFSLSNQMKRLTGLRPSEAREHLGWEWVLEAWLRREAKNGGLSIPLRGFFADRSHLESGGVRHRSETRKHAALPVTKDRASAG